MWSWMGWLWRMTLLLVAMLSLPAHVLACFSEIAAAQLETRVLFLLCIMRDQSGGLTDWHGARANRSASRPEPYASAVSAFMTGDWLMAGKSFVLQGFYTKSVLFEYGQIVDKIFSCKTIPLQHRNIVDTVHQMSMICQTGLFCRTEGLQEKPVLATKQWRCIVYECTMNACRCTYMPELFLSRPAVMLLFIVEYTRECCRGKCGDGPCDAPENMHNYLLTFCTLSLLFHWI